MKYYFVDIQEYFNELLGIQDTQSGPIIITLFVFISGFLINGVIKGIGEYNQRKAYRGLFVKIIQSAVSSVKERMATLEEQIEALSNKDGRHILSNAVPFFQKDLLSSVGFKATFESFTRGLENRIKSKSIKKINDALIIVWENIYKLIKFEDMMADGTSNARDTLNEINQKRLPSVLRKFNECYHEMVRGYVNDTLSEHELIFANELMECIIHWQKLDDPTSPENDFEHRIKKAIAICDKYGIQPITKEFGTFAAEAHFHYENYFQVLEYLNKQFINHKVFLDSFLISTENKINILLKLKPK